MKRNRSDELEQLLSDYMDGALSDADRARVENALKSDANLRATLDAYRRVGDIAKDGEFPTDNQPFDAYFESIAAQLANIEPETEPPVEDETQREPVVVTVGGGGFRYAAYYVPGALAAMLLLAFGVMWWQNSKVDPTDSSELAATGDATPNASVLSMESQDESSVSDTEQEVQPIAAKQATAPDAHNDDNLVAAAPVTDASTSSPAPLSLRSASDAIARTQPTSLTEARRMAVAATAKAVPYSVRVLSGEEAVYEGTLDTETELVFQYRGNDYRVRLERDEDDRWTLSSDYTPVGETASEESRERYFDLIDDPADGATATQKYRIAQPLSLSPRLFVELVPAKTTTSEENAP
ncbi:MAG: zf-HC2 domain-containing protein [Candidatus Poribacteria bacterium]|nr:zf-HC2 domain-containing protein [Candidatus Poribacteria bacterium]